jgi:hypothetical protein
LDHRDKDLPARLAAEEGLLFRPGLAFEDTEAAFSVENVNELSDIRIGQVRNWNLDVWRILERSGMGHAL